MQIHLTATTAAHPAQFAFVIRREILAALPSAEVHVRAVPAPLATRLHTIETDEEAAFMREALPDLLELVRDDLASDMPVFLYG